VTDIRKVYAHVVCFFCLLIGGFYLSIATYSVGEILFTNILLPMTVHSDRTYETTLESHEIEKRRLSSGTSAKPYQHTIGAPLPYGTTEWVRKEKIGVAVSALTKFLFSLLIFVIHWRMGKPNNATQQS